MSQHYDYFVIFAEMRTGSNFLEENVNSYPGLKCWGEIYNPHFVGKPNNKDFGISTITILGCLVHSSVINGFAEFALPDHIFR